MVEDAEVELYITDENSRLQQEGSAINVQLFFMPPYDFAQKIWRSFFDLCPDKTRKNFVLVHGHGAGFGFSPRKPVLKFVHGAELNTDKVREIFKNVQNITKLFSNDIYSDELPDKILEVKTYYEEMNMKKGKTIKYVKFRL